LSNFKEGFLGRKLYVASPENYIYHKIGTASMAAVLYLTYIYKMAPAVFFKSYTLVIN
jgi:hypothetical protein